MNMPKTVARHPAIPPPFLFVLGCERSGTTLLRAMLDSGSQMAIPGESYFIVELLKRRRRYESSRGLDVDRVMRDLQAHAWFQRWKLNPEMLRDRVTEADARSVPDFVRATYRL